MYIPKRLFHNELQQVNLPWGKHVIYLIYQPICVKRLTVALT